MKTKGTKIGKTAAIGILIITMLIMNYAITWGNRFARPLIAGAIAGGLTLLVLVIKGNRGANEQDQILGLEAKPTAPLKEQANDDPIENK